MKLFIIILILIFMAVLNWGDLTKSQVDDETIEQAIARIVAQHNDDAESHLAVGQSLQSHKAYEIIDHLASSIISDKVADYQITPDHLVFTKSVYTSNFQDFALWTTAQVGGVITNSLGLANLYVNSGIGNYARLYASSNSFKPHSMSRASVFQAFCWIENDYIPYTAKIGFGTVGYSFAGFKWSGDRLFVVLRNHAGTEVTAEITGYVCYDWHLYKVVLRPGVGADFYIDNVLVSQLEQAATSDYQQMAIFEISGPNGDYNDMQIKQIQFYE